MGRYDPKYTDDQREAIARAIVEQGMSAPAAVAKAAEGLEGLDPFTMAESTAREIAREARRYPTGDEQADPDYVAVIRDLLERCLALNGRHLAALEKAQEDGQDLSNPQLTRMVKLLRMLNVLSATWRMVESGPAGQASARPVPPAETGAVEKMLARLETVPSNGVTQDGDEGD